MIKEIINIVFAACCVMMFGMGEMFGTTYEFVNVILFCYVEPILTALMLVAAAYVLLKGPAYRKVANFFKWFAIIFGTMTFILLFVSGIYALNILDLRNLDSASIDTIINRVYRPDPSPHIHKLYKMTYDWLINNCGNGIGYNALNLIVYVISMPAVILSSIYICHKRRKCQPAID